MNDRPRPGQNVVLKENPAAYLARDAKRALELARAADKSGNDEDEATFSRTAALMYFSALEGLINFVYEWSEVPHDEWRRWSIRKKWANAAEQCLPHLGIITDESGVDHPPSGPFQSVPDDTHSWRRFLELKEVRNAMAHSEPSFAALPVERVVSHIERDEYYPLTRLPKRLARFRREHAEAAASIYEDMTTRMDVCFRGTVRHLFDAPSVIEYVTIDSPDER
jgi:hypothetical protein